MFTACAGLPASTGGRYDHRFALPVERAAQCFAHNAQAHSSALVPEVTPLKNGRMDVVVRVRNGVSYATATLEPSDGGSAGTIRLNVDSSEGNRSLVESLVQGC